MQHKGEKPGTFVGIAGERVGFVQLSRPFCFYRIVDHMSHLLNYLQVIECVRARL
jgi:hypothetical protein